MLNMFSGSRNLAFVHFQKDVCGMSVRKTKSAVKEYLPNNLGVEDTADD